MDGRTLVDRIRESQRTELSRLGSEKALLAVTDADLASGTVLETLAVALGGLRTTLEEWADGTADEDVREVFTDAAASLEREYERILAELEDEPTGEPPAPLETVRGFDRPPERVAAAFVGHGLVLDGTLLQVVSFFVNEADESRANLARDLRDGANDRVEEGVAVLDSVCTSDEEWERAEAAAVEVVEAAYRDYAETLDGMGIDPRPVC